MSILKRRLNYTRGYTNKIHLSGKCRYLCRGSAVSLPLRLISRMAVQLEWKQAGECMI